MSSPIDTDRLMNAYARALRRYLAAERALVEASEPVSVELVYEHDTAAEDFRTIRGYFQSSFTRSNALNAVEDWERPDDAGEVAFP